jgi:hypothetical protein
MVKNQKRNLFREAVKPTEEGGTFDPSKAAQKRQELLRQRGAEVKSQATQQTSTPVAPNTSSATNKPSPIVGRADPSTSQGQAAIATNQQPVQQATTQQPVQQATTQQTTTQQPVQQATTQQTTTQQPVQQTSNQNVDDGETEEIQTIQQSNTQVQPLVTSDDGEGYTADEIEKMINSVTTTALASPDQDEEENFKNKSTVSEKRNIAKFLKFLSEKNYAVANKYLKNIVQNKIKRKISGAIK